MPKTTLLPRGIPLTEQMPFTGRDGTPWIAYIEGAPPEYPWGMWYRTMLPGRRLRFDSHAESRAAPTVPAGAPFLSESRLQLLLESAQPVPPPPPLPRTRYKPWRRNVLVRWFSRAADLGDAVRMESAQRWHAGASHRREIRYRIRQTLSRTTHALTGTIERGESRSRASS